jgi:hypothetical protein
LLDSQNRLLSEILRDGVGRGYLVPEDIPQLPLAKKSGVFSFLRKRKDAGF